MAEASSSSFESSTSTSTSNPEAEGRSRPPDEAPKLELAEQQHQHQSTESGIGDEVSFSFPHSASDDHIETLFHAFSVDNSCKTLKPINVEGASNGVLFENQSLSSSSEGDDFVPVKASDDVLVDLDGIDLPSLNAMSNSPAKSFVRVEQVQPAFYSDICQENERILRKTASVSKNPKMTDYLLRKNQTIDNELCNVEQHLKKRNEDLQLQLHLQEKEVESLKNDLESLRNELDETKRENKFLRGMLEWEIRKGVSEMDTKNHEKTRLRMKQPNLRKLNDPKNQLAKAEQKFESCQQQIRELKGENAELHARNAVNEAEAVRLEKEKTAAIKEMEEELQALVSTLHQLIEERVDSIHSHLCSVSKTYALHYPKTRTGSFAALHLETSSLSLNRVSSSAQPSMKGKPESSSMPVGADVTQFACPDLASVSGLELCTIEEKKSSVLELSMESEIPPHDLVSLASYFDNVDLLVGLLPLSAAVVSDVVNKKHSHTTQSAVHYGLLSWGRIKPEEVTFQALIDIAHKLTREDIVRNIKEYFYKNYRNM